MSENLKTTLNPLTIKSSISNKETINVTTTIPSKVLEKDYNKLENKPSINGVELQGDKSFEDLGRYNVTNFRLKEIIDSQYDNVFGGN